MSSFLTFLFVFFLVIIFMVIGFISRFVRLFTKQFRSQQSSRSQYRTDTDKNERNTPQSNKKIFPKNEGEYVDYEEIKDN